MGRSTVSRDHGEKLNCHTQQVGLCTISRWLGVSLIACFAAVRESIFEHRALTLEKVTLDRSASRDYVKPVKCACDDLELARHPSSAQPIGVVEVLAVEQVIGATPIHAGGSPDRSDCRAGTATRGSAAPR